MTEMLAIPALDAAGLASAVATLLGRAASELRPDVLGAIQQALSREDDVRARRALSMLSENARIAAEDQVPICQDTGSVWVLLEVGLHPATERPLSLPSDILSQVDAAVSWVWRERALRNSMLADALNDRNNTGDNSPAFCELSFDPALHGARLSVMLKGGGSDNASALAMLAPSDGWPAILQLIVNQVADKGANACPPLVVGVGVGSTYDHVGSLAKRALLRPVGSANPDTALATLEAEALAAVNALGIGPGAMGGNTTALAVHIVTTPCHMASLPVAVNLGCSAMRSLTVELTGGWLS